MAIHRTRKNKQNPHYQFLVSWKPTEPRVKRELKNSLASDLVVPGKPKRAQISDKVAEPSRIKVSIFRSLILIGIVLTLEVVVYLAWNKYILP